jgi:predicted nucleotidyltransferase
MDRKELLNRIKSSIKSKDPEADIYLYGSRARGDENKNSDWDILVVTPKERITFEYESELRIPIFDLELDSGEVISVLVYSKSDWQKRKSISPLFTNVSKEGIRI